MDKRVLISTIIAVSLLLTSCGSSAASAPAAPAPEPTPEPVKEEVKEEVEEETADIKTDTSAEAQTDLKKPNDSSLAAVSKLMSSESDKTDASSIYTDDFDDEPDYDEYNSADNEKELKGDLLCLEGTATRYETKIRKALILETDDGEWAIDGGKNGTEKFYELLKACVDEDIRVFCSYEGYDKKLEMPVVSFISDTSLKYSYRLEVPDEDIRLAYTDYALTAPKLSQEEKVGKIKFKEPKKWKKDTDKGEDCEQIVYVAENQGAYRMFMAYFYEMPEGTFDSIDRNELLESVAESFATDGTELRKEPVEVLERDGLCVETSFKDETIEFPMDLYSYVFTADDGVYYFGVGDPYLISETGKQLLHDIVDTFVHDDGTTNKQEKKEEAKKEETKKEESKKTEEKAEETKKEEPKTQHEAGTHPTKSELQGKVFSQYVSGTLTDMATGEPIPYNEKLPNAVISAGDMANYYEPAGTLTYTENDTGMAMGMQLEFFYDFSGKLMYKGKAIIHEAEYMGELDVSGMEL